MTDQLLASATALANQFQEWSYTTFTEGGYPRREMDLIREAGFLTVTLPGEVLDFRGGRTEELLALLIEIGRGNLSVGRIYEGHLNALLLLHHFATPAQREHYYAEARAGHLFGVWNTQFADGIRLHPLASGSVRMEGSKTFCSGSTNVTRPIVTGALCATDGKEIGWQITVVDLDESCARVDESFWNPLGMRNSVSHKIDFTDIQLSPRHLIGEPEDYNRQPHLSAGAIRFAAVHLGAAQALLDVTRLHLRRAERTEDPHQRRRIGKMAILVESGRLWLARAGKINDSVAADPVQIITYANMARTLIADVCTECLQLAESSIGAAGFLHPHPLARLHADLGTYLRQPAPDATLDQVGEYTFAHANPI